MVIEHSKDLFKINRWIWKFTGLIWPKKYRILYFIWILVFNVGVTFFYPFHLIMGLFQLCTEDDIFKNLSINFTDLVCSIKFVIIWYNLKNIFIIEDIITTLDKRIQTNEEKIHFQEIERICKYVFYSLGIVYAGACIASELSTLISDERRLLYPAWIPIDWNKSNINYWITNIYQFVGLSLQVLTNYANDTYPPVSLALLGGHIRFLAIRLSKLGTDPNKSQKDNNMELKMCIRDHQILIESYYILSKVLSKGMFFQILGTGFNMGCSVIYLVYYAGDIFSTLYYITFLMALPLQIFPSCYLGSVFEMEFSNLPYAVFSCNWMDQDKEFKKNVMIFSQRGFQSVQFLCMGFFKIHLNSFYVAMKTAYSLFAVIMRTK